MTPAKLIIKPEDKAEIAKGVPYLSFEALYNPSELKLTRQVNWKELEPANGTSGGLQFHGTSAWMLSLELFFDTYDRSGDPGGLVSALLDAVPALGLKRDDPPGPKSVFDEMAPLLALAVPAIELHRPPYCYVLWGKQSFRCVLQQANPTLTLFHADGTPVRATVSCTFQEWSTGPLVEFHSPDVAKRHIVQSGDTLMALACHYYDDRSQWRRIADVNRLDDPRELVPGTLLLIPRIR